MNIKDAKREIVNTAKAYLKKKANGEYAIPDIRQRPILMIGPPGIGKTQIMEQIADELGINLVAYTITHHTRQSAVGLPMISRETFDDTEYSVTEYTMSEIIASVHRKIKETGIREGILFIDEINCVSETLAPTMLQFLQCKTFGNVKVPTGWIIVAAGNPAGYNKSVREFDMVTLDRVRFISVEADYGVWKEYAREKNIHPALLGYLELYSKDFYRVEQDVDGLLYVTARGWEDLSELIYIYEELGINVTRDVIFEYLHHADVAENVSAYYDLYKKYEKEYEIEEILQGKATPDIFARLMEAAFDERVSVLEMLLAGVNNVLTKTSEARKECEEIYKDIKSRLETSDQDSISSLKSMLEDKSRALEKMEDYTLNCLENSFNFIVDAFGEKTELTIFMTELSLNKSAISFMNENPCESYNKYYEKLMIGSRRGDLLARLER